MSKELVLELIEEYEFAGQHRMRFRIKGTNVIINVSASSIEEGVKKAMEIIRKTGIKA